jgi:hypothetical protein
MRAAGTVNRPVSREPFFGVEPTMWIVRSPSLTARSPMTSIRIVRTGMSIVA